MTDQAFRTFPQKMINGGLISRYAYDRLPPGRFLNLDNVESREEGTLSSRYGLAAISTNGTNTNYPLGAAVTSLGRMQGLSNPYNYAQAGANLFRKAGDGVGSYGAAISTALSGSRMSMYPYRPNNSSKPYMFLADDDVLLKDSGAGSVAQNWGIAPPTQPALIAPGVPDLLDIELFDESSDSSFTLSGLSGGAMLSRIQTTLQTAVTTPGVQFVEVAGNSVVSIVRSSGISTVTTFGAHGYASGMRVAITATSDPTFAVASTIITVTSTFAFTYVNAGSNGTITNGTINAGPSLQVGMSITTTDGNAETVYITAVETIAGFPGFIASFAKTHSIGCGISSGYLSGSVAANSNATITKAGALNISFTNAQDQPDQNFIQLYILASSPLAISQISIQFDVGDGTFTQDYYSSAVAMSPAQTVASGTGLAGAAQAIAVAERAAGKLGVSTLGGNNPSLLPIDYPLLQQLQPSVLNPGGANPWSYIAVPLANFVANGAAGGPNNNWTNVVAWRIQIQTQATLTTTVGFDDFVFVGGSDLNSFAGQAYDYRYTYLNMNTGCESGPSQIMVATDPTTFVSYSDTINAFLPIPLAVQNSAIAVQPLQPTDTQVTHINIYRRGGTLTSAWFFTAQIPVGQATFVDTVADSIIEDNQELNVDADAPVTSLLPSPVNTTLTVTSGGTVSIGPGETTGNIPAGPFFDPTLIYPGQLITVGAAGAQEQAYVQSVTQVSHQLVVTLYLQLNHGSAFLTVSTPVTATTRPQTPMNLMAIAFDKAWLAGDPNNPHVLYYSLTYSPETFPVENSLEIGTPDAPIMAVIEMSGLLFVFTTKRVYEIIGAGTAVPTVIPTGVKHGMAAQFAWCVAEGVIYYFSYDGVYAFSGGQSSYMTEPVEWIWTGKNLGPVQAINLTQKSQIVMAYWNHEIFCRYVDQNGNSHRLISHETYGFRWRNDDQAVGNITAMYLAEDTGELFVGKDDGMVYQDRVNDFDSGGWNSSGQIKNSINYTIQTAQNDLSDVDPLNAKRNKLFQEYTLDFDSAGQPVSVSLLFNGGASVPNGTTLFLGTFSQAGRGQIQIPINAGDGQEALNIGVLLTGFATTVVTFYASEFRAAPQAEFRQSFDSWWLGEGSSDWKLVKQVFAEYKSQNSSITVNAFTDGNMTTPAFTFVLPQTTGPHRASKKVRLPATKYRLIRYIGTPTNGVQPNQTNNFELYDDTEFDVKSLTAGNSYQRSKISP